MWNEIAPRYHRKWATQNTGPWKSTEKLVKLSNIKKGDRVLDIACGTGIVTKKIKAKVGKKGHVVGIDTSMTAIKIAKKWNNTATNNHNLDFINGDAEKFNFTKKFDVVTCQYALFFFPNSQRALKNIAKNLKKTGILGISVHGNNTPYYSSITDIVSKFIPNYLSTNTVKLDRFGTGQKLKKEIRKAGFHKISINEFIFYFSPGTFDEYWNNYKRYVSQPIKKKFDVLSRQEKLEMRYKIKEKTIPYTKKDGKIVFPWQVLISTSNPP